jgi:transcription antitermination factor NusG
MTAKKSNYLLMKLNTSKNSDNQFPTNWYAIYTKARAEKKVFERLTLNGFNAYLPLITSIREWSDRKKKIVTPLISSYVFVNTSKNTVFDTLKIKGTSGLLKYLGKPAIIKDYEIENLKILMNDIEQVSMLEDIEFEKGEEVEVMKGPFKGLIAQSVCIQGKNRIIVEIEAMGRSLVVNIPLTHVKKRISPR